MKKKVPAMKKSSIKPTPSIAKKRKGKEQRQNYKEMSNVDFALMRQKDWYVTMPRDNEIEDPNFWCMEQLFINRDIYLSYKHRIHPMLPMKLNALKAKSNFTHAAHVVEQFGLVTLMEKQCDYSVPLVLQFFSTLVIEDDIHKTLKWMTGTTVCESSFTKFATILGYSFRGHPPLGHRMHSTDKPTRTGV